MQKLLCIFAVLSVMLSAELVSAKIYWLPDFLGENTDRNNPLDSDENSNNNLAECPAGWISAAQKGSMVCDEQRSFPNVGYCYRSCKEPCDTVTNHDCGAFECLQYYESCPSKCEICYEDNCRNRTDNLINAEWGCEKSWADCEAKCEVPYSDNCHNRADNLINAEWGCEKYWDDCEAKCEDPKTDNCDNRADNLTDYGCQKYWDDCPTKCEQGKTCVAIDCSAYPLTTPPANALYEECVVGCGDSVKHYRFIGCKTGFYDKKSFVCENKQICTWTIK